MAPGTATPDVRIEGDEPLDKPGVPQVVKDAAVGTKLDAEQQDTALAWMLSDDTDAAQENKKLNLNVGTQANPRWIPWEIQNVDRDVLKQIQRQAAGNRAQRRGGNNEPDQAEANVRVVAAATVSPDLDEVAQRKGIDRAPDPMWHRMQVLKWRFRDKPGLIDQIAGRVMDVSGYDDEDVQDVEVTAAGN